MYIYNTSRLGALYGHSLINNPSPGMKIHPFWPISIDHVTIKTSQVMLRCWGNVFCCFVTLVRSIFWFSDIGSIITHWCSVLVLWIWELWMTDGAFWATVKCPFLSEALKLWLFQPPCDSLVEPYEASLQVLTVNCWLKCAVRSFPPSSNSCKAVEIWKCGIFECCVREV